MLKWRRLNELLRGSKIKEIKIIIWNESIENRKKEKSKDGEDSDECEDKKKNRVKGGREWEGGDYKRKKEKRNGGCGNKDRKKKGLWGEKNGVEERKEVKEEMMIGKIKNKNKVFGYKKEKGDKK